eukprot:TRINITY_DN2549_c0_g1_i1.p1 TRINITY_DN2549_c0_g1~~TRINITY_DN2549_c0_g1_i1.p1  ORF type:complete len:720 (+),score=240.89 TRINITY_DN2549_c0_g1_i1:91-2160(+)
MASEAGESQASREESRVATGSFQTVPLMAASQMLRSRGGEPPEGMETPEGTIGCQQQAKLDWMQIRRAAHQGASKRARQLTSPVQVQELVDQWDNLLPSINHSVNRRALEGSQVGTGSVVSSRRRRGQSLMGRRADNADAPLRGLVHSASGRSAGQGAAGMVAGIRVDELFMPGPQGLSPETSMMQSVASAPPFSLSQAHELAPHTPSGRGPASEGTFEDPQTLPEALLVIQDLRAAVASLEDTLYEAGGLGMELRNKLDSAKVDLEDRDLRISEQEEEISLLEEELARLEAEQKQALRDVRSTRSRVRELEAEHVYLKETEQANQKLQDELHAAREALRDAEREVEDLRSAGWCVQEARQQLKQTQEQAQQLEEGRADLDARLAHVQTKEEVVAVAEEAGARLVLAQNELREARTAHTRYRLWNVTQRVRLARDLDAAKEQLRSSEAQSQRQLNDLKRRLADARAELASETERLRAELEGAQRSLKSGRAGFKKEAAFLGARAAELETELQGARIQLREREAAVRSAALRESDLEAALEDAQEQLARRAAISADDLQRRNAEETRLRDALAAAELELAELRPIVADAQDVRALRGRNDFVEAALRLLHREAEQKDARIAELEALLVPAERPPKCDPDPEPPPRDPGPAVSWAVTAASCAWQDYDSRRRASPAGCSPRSASPVCPACRS